MRRLIDLAGRRVSVSGRLLRIARLEGDGYDFLDDPEPLLGGLRTGGARVDLFTFVQRLPDTAPRHHYPMQWDNFAALPISTFDVWWTTQIDDKTRNMVRRAEKKGVSVREVSFGERLVDGICAVYNEAAVRQGKPNRHYGKDVAAVRAEAATFLERTVWIGAYLEETLIGFAKLTSDATRSQAGLMNVVAMIRHRDKAPANALIAQAVRSCAARGIPYLVYSRFAYGRKQRDALADFKRHNGFYRIDVPRYFVPLTRFGQVAFRLGLHKRVVERLPEPLLARLRGLRAAWYHRKLHSAVEAS